MISAIREVAQIRYPITRIRLRSAQNFGARWQWPSFTHSFEIRLLNEELITRAESFPNVQIHFNHKFVNCDFDAGRLVFEVPSDDG